MHRVSRVSLMVLLTAWLMPVAARAQTTSQVGVRAWFGVDVNKMAASDSFDAVLGSAQLLGFGGGADVTVWKNVFARVSFSRAKKDGERAVVFNGQVIPIGVPITVTYTPIEIGGGWQFPLAGGVRPYAGAGLFRLRYKEESDFGIPDEEVDLSKSGYVVFGGVEVPVSKYLMVGGEAQYRSVPDAVGTGGVSRDFDETNLGGFTVRVLFGIRR
jgi:opacity protein-like surface antigen